jgi:hypothetical protein
MQTKLSVAETAIKRFSERGGLSRAPKIVVGGRRFRGCCYNSVLHRIKIAKDLLEQMPDVVLQAMLAHEVGHARQRKEILTDAIRCIAIYLGMAALAFACIAPIIDKNKGAAVALLVIWMIATVRYASKQEKADLNASRLRENDADDFSAKCMGGYQIVVDMLNTHAMIDGKALGAEASSRVARMKKILAEGS